MYKELNDSIKKYSPSGPELENIRNRFLAHSFIHCGDNLYGEMYEAWVYEFLKSWALVCDDVSFFVRKVGTPQGDLVNGLTYDKNGQIIFYDNGLKVAEFDGLFIFKKRIVFVESSVSELRSYYRRLEDRLVKKRLLLSKFFNTDEVYSLVVTRPKKRSLVYRSLPNLVLYKLKDPDFSNMKVSRVSEESVLCNSPKLVDLDSISSLFSSSF